MNKGLQKLTEISRAFRPAKMLLTACELDLFDRLETPSTAAEVARAAKANERAVGILLDGLAALGLVRKQGGAYRNGQEVSKWLVSGKPDYRGAIFKHMANCWHGWTGLTETIKTGRSGDDERDWHKGERRDFILGMHAIARDLAPRLAGLLPLPEQGRAIDIGGGPGTYDMAFCRRRPGLTSTLFDLPETIKIARGVIKAEGQDVASRIKLKAGDFTTDELGSGFDFAWISQILHAYSEADCAALIGKAYGALAPGGVAAVHEFALNESKTAPVDAALFSVHMLAVTPGGRAYSRGEITGWMREAGFKRVKAMGATPASIIIMGYK
jgi:hypothetical protein